MAADLVSVAHAFVTALVSNAAARDEFSAAMHPPDPARAVAVINLYAGASETPISAADLPSLVSLIGKALDDARAGGATTVPASIMPGEGGASGSIMTGDAGGASGSIMTGDPGGTAASIMPHDTGGTSASIMPGDSESKPKDE